MHIVEECLPAHREGLVAPGFETVGQPAGPASQRAGVVDQPAFAAQPSLTGFAPEPSMPAIDLRVPATVLHYSAVGSLGRLRGLSHQIGQC